LTDSRSESQWRRTLDYLETAMAGVSVTMEDCGWPPIGVEVACRAYEGLRPSTCLGRQVTHARYLPAGMDKQEMPSGTLIRDAEFEQLRRAKELYLKVRLPVHCEAERGVCAVCYGADPESGALEPVGSPIGEMAVRALRFPRRASMRRELSFHLGEGVLRCPAPSSGTVRLAVPPDLQLERGRDQFLDSPFCRVVRDPDGSGSVVSLFVGDAAEPILLEEESRLIVEAGDRVEAGQIVAYRRPWWARPFRGRLPLLVRLLEVRKPPNRALLSPLLGYVRLSKSERGLLQIEVEAARLGRPENGVLRLEVDPEQERSWIGEITDEGDLRVADGEPVRGGEALTWGTEWVRDVFNAQGDGGAATHLALDLEDALDVNRMLVDPRAIALIVGRMLSFVRVYPSNDQELPGWIPSGVLEGRTWWRLCKERASDPSVRLFSAGGLVLGARQMALMLRRVNRPRA
jgi:hypothetical protein